MLAEIISVGTELLMGQIVNTNAQYIAARLAEAGVDTYFQVVVGDNAARMKQTVKTALERSDVVIATGGLGPTQDDITKETIAELLGIPLVRDEASVRHITDYFARLGRLGSMTDNNLKQAMMPEGCIVLPNPNGTAPGCIIEKDGKAVAILPGPPIEMRPMFDDYVMPYLANKSEYIISSRILKIFGRGESHVADILKDLIDGQTNPTIAPYASLGQVMLRITAKCKKGENPDLLIEPVEREIRSRIGDYIYATGNATMDNTVAALLLEKNVKIAVAESCTGGMFASQLIENPGISAVFVEGIVAYSNESKLARGLVSRETLEKHGAVSEETAISMAKAMLSSGADAAISTTGIAGPDGGTPEKPVGLVYVGFASRNKAYAKRFTFTGNRDRIRQLAVLNAMNLLRLELLNWE